ncbi:GntR family transcriptional regulator [Lentilactobacillus diolivorans]|nr:GntR family transcriptional regulator [Lentilactobacillus diolivorans]
MVLWNPLQNKLNGAEPIYLQIANQIEDAIATGKFKEGKQIPSAIKVSHAYHIDPATVLKGMNVVVEKNLINKRRGRGLFVVNGARQRIIDMKKAHFFRRAVIEMVRKAQNIGLSESELLTIVKLGYRQRRHLKSQ